MRVVEPNGDAETHTAPGDNRMTDKQKIPPHEPEYILRIYDHVSHAAPAIVAGFVVVETAGNNSNAYETTHRTNLPPLRFSDRKRAERAAEILSAVTKKTVHIAEVDPGTTLEFVKREREYQYSPATQTYREVKPARPPQVNYDVRPPEPEISRAVCTKRFLTTTDLICRMDRQKGVV